MIAIRWKVDIELGLVTEHFEKMLWYPQLYNYLYCWKTAIDSGEKAIMINTTSLALSNIFGMDITTIYSPCALAL